MYFEDTRDIGKTQCCSLYLVRIWVSRIEGEFAHFEVVLFILHSHMLSKIPHLASGFCSSGKSAECDALVAAMVEAGLYLIKSCTIK